MNAPSAAINGQEVTRAFKRQAKPPYEIPSMEDISNVPHNGYNVISTFSGAGGSSLGYKMAGFNVLWANEFIPEAQDTYRANFPKTHLDTRDIRTIEAKDILDKIGLKAGELDVFDGSPPCASFSTAGKRSEGWGKVKAYSSTKQRTDDLFFEYARLLKDLQPKVFIAENVSGLVKGVAKGYFLEILKELKACGYNVNAKLLNTKWLGVPQKRQRLIFMGVRIDLNKKPKHPTPLIYSYTFQDACETLKSAGDFRAMTPTTKTYRLWRWLCENNKYSFEDAHKAIYGKSSMIQHYRINPNDSINTVVQASSSLYHSHEPRSLGISELKRTSSFPDDFILTGTYAQQWERIGRAVPPIMMKHIALSVKEVLDSL